MEKWIADSPDQAGTAFNEFVGNLYQRNALIKDKFVVDNQIVNLSEIRCPVLNIYALADHLVPASASKALANYVGCDDYSELTFDGGHIGIYVSRQAQQSIPASIGRWILARS
jgi:polyhydroxyalkanoate synthase